MRLGGSILSGNSQIDPLGPVEQPALQVPIHRVFNSMCAGYK